MTDESTRALLLGLIEAMHDRLDSFEQVLRDHRTATAEDRACVTALMCTTARHEEQLLDLTNRMERIKNRFDPAI